jgi:hypothetical protein
MADAVSRTVDPALSAILPIDRTETGAETIDALRSQALDVPLELVLVGIDGRVPEPPEASEDFAAVRRVASEGLALSDARSAGARAATAPYVVIVETHSFPQPGWARGIVNRLDEGWVGVGPGVEPANPARRAVAMTLFAYGRWMGGPAGRWPSIPGHNSAYQRKALLAALDRSPDGMDEETILQQHMRAAGGELYLDLAVRVRHIDVEDYGALAREWVAFSRVYATRRAADWGPIRRAVYAAGSPLLPLIRLIRCVREARRGGFLGELLRGADMLAVSLVASAAGELMGYATRRCDPAATLEIELYRRRWAASAP